jgi:crotonobetainyl-CoA:carnitine CoA-transferase CaiB-like acyl-CoA transferase
VTSALDSIRVIELTEALAGPYCAMLLGDFGADVIKVERPGSGDQTRGWGPPFVGGESAYFLATNRNKRSITLNYDEPRDAEILQRLLATADVFISNQASLSSMKKRGLDPHSLHSKYPRLIHSNISGYGLTGPKTGRPGYDILAQAESGVMTFTGEPEGEPMRYPIAIADMTCGMYTAMGILAALFAREKTGRGQFLDMSLFDSQLTWLANIGSNYLNANALPQRWGNAHPSIVPYQMFRGGDAKYFVVGVGSELLWKKFVHVLNAEQTLGADPRFVNNPLRIANRAELIATLQSQFDREPASAWLDKLARAGVPAAPINTVPEALNDAQTLARGLIVQLEHPSLGQARSIANPIRFSDTPVSYRLPPPLLGEHTAQILDSLGYAKDDAENPAQSNQGGRQT